MPPTRAASARRDATPVSIDVAIANETAAAVPAARIRAAIEAVVDGSPYRQVAVSVAVVDDPTIHDLNRRFLDHDYATDVLSFALDDEPPRLEGEIIVSRDTAERCAAEAGWSGDDELLLYVIHGALHLVGHGDKTPADEAAMLAAEAAVLNKLGVRRSASDARWTPVEPLAASPAVRQEAPS